MCVAITNWLTKCHHGPLMSFTGFGLFDYVQGESKLSPMRGWAVTHLWRPDEPHHISKSCCWEILTMQILGKICIVRTMHPMTAESFGCFCIFIAIRQLYQKLAVCRKVPSTCCDKTVVWEPLSVKSSCFHWPNAGVSTEVLLSHACVFPYCLNKEESCALVGVSWG